MGSRVWIPFHVDPKIWASCATLRRWGLRVAPGFRIDLKFMLVARSVDNTRERNVIFLSLETPAERSDCSRHEFGCCLALYESPSAAPHFGAETRIPHCHCIRVSALLSVVSIQKQRRAFLKSTRGRASESGKSEIGTGIGIGIGWTYIQVYMSVFR